jgi:hypothetical protein
VLVLGIVGALLCVIERPAPAAGDSGALLDADGALDGRGSRSGSGSKAAHSGSRYSTASTFRASSAQPTPAHDSVAVVSSRVDAEDNARPLLPGAESTAVASDWRTSLRNVATSCRFVIPLVSLAVAYCLWSVGRGGWLACAFCALRAWHAVVANSPSPLRFVFMKFFTDSYRVNAWGYNSLDQGLLPFYTFPFLLLIDSVPFLKRNFENEQDCQETFFQAVRGTCAEITSSWDSFWTVFVYRGLINGRAVFYSFIAVWYDLDVVYLELTLIRICLSWIASLVLCIWAPRFIRTTVEEKKMIFSRANLALKIVGTCVVGAALIVLNTEKTTAAAASSSTC